MLIIGRNPGEYLVINGNVFVKVIRIKGGLKLAVDAPMDVTIERGETYEKTHPCPDQEPHCD